MGKASADRQCFSVQQKVTDDDFVFVIFRRWESFSTPSALKRAQSCLGFRTGSSALAFPAAVLRPVCRKLRGP